MESTSDIIGESLLTEADMELIDALQVNPRISWTKLAPTLGVDAATVGRKWTRLTEAGHAWTSAALGMRQLHSMSMVFIELDCESGASPEVAKTLSGFGHVITVQHMSGNFDLFVIAIAPSLPPLADYLLTELPTIPGVRKARSSIGTRIFDASRQWRLRILPNTSMPEISGHVQSPTSTRPMDDLDKNLFRALSSNGRASNAYLGELLSTTERTVQRRIRRLQAVGDVTFRCDLALPLAGWNAAAVLWLEVPDSHLDDAGRELLTWPETRTCAATTGPSNLLLTVSMRNVADLHPLVARIFERFPSVKVLDRNIVLRKAKLYGKILNSRGVRVDSVPVDPWAIHSPGM